MEFWLSILTGVLFTGGIFLLLHRDFVKLVIGIVVLGNATALFVFVAGGVVRDVAPLIVSPEGDLPEKFADPVPQALILTALVISFGIQAFALVLFKKVYDVHGVDEADDLKK